MAKGSIRDADPTPLHRAAWLIFPVAMNRFRVMAENLASGNGAVALLGNTLATGAMPFDLPIHSQVGGERQDTDDAHRCWLGRGAAQGSDKRGRQIVGHQLPPRQSSSRTGICTL